MPHEKFRALVDSRFQAVDNTFSVAGQPMYWNKYEIKTAIYLFGLREAEYAMPLEALLQANPNGRMSDSTKIMGNMQLWVNNHRTTLSSDAVSAQLALAAIDVPSKKPAAALPGINPPRKPCHVCNSFGRTENAKNHTADNCYVNKASPKFSQPSYDKIMKSRQKFLEKHTASTVPVSAPLATSTPASKLSSGDRHLRALISLHEDADTPERKLSALAAVSDYAAMMANGSETMTTP